MKNDLSFDHYKHYKADDFVLDSYFRRWILNPDKSSNIFWEQWISENSSRVGEIKKARELLISLKAVEYKPGEEVQQEVWNGIVSKITRRQPDGSRTLPLGPRSIISGYDSRRKHKTFKWSRIAASIAILVTLLLSYNYLKKFHSNQDVAVESEIVKENPIGQRSTIMMSDGTKVILNAQSKLIYSSGYGTTNREIWLEGEAFFEVTKDKALPFIVKTNYLSTRALGTSFNISAYENEAFEVSLFTGIVDVYDHSSLNSYQEKLLPGEKVVSGDGLNFQKKDFDLTSAAQWRTGVIVFKNTTLKEAITILERWYGVNIECDDSRAEELTFSGNFDDEYLFTVLEVLGYNMDFEYKIDDKNVLITFKNNDMNK